MLSTVHDHILLTKESLKNRICGSYASPHADRLIKYLGLKGVERVIHGKPDTIIILSHNMVVRVPMDYSSAVRCRVNYSTIKRLARTGIAPYVPIAIDSAKFRDRPYYCESRLPGVAIDIPISRIDELIDKAADLITKFHQETARDIILDEAGFKSLFGRDFFRLYPYLDNEYKTKLSSIESGMKRQLLGKPLKTVWFHGDYKIENVLFDTSSWNIRGVIDWDLSRQSGLPLLDILYLLAYKDVLVFKKSMIEILEDIIFNSKNLIFKKTAFSTYVKLFNISKNMLHILKTIFWLNNIIERYHQQIDISAKAKDDWFLLNVNSVIDRIF